MSRKGWKFAKRNDILIHTGRLLPEAKKKEGFFLSKFAVFVDLENCGAKVATLNSILEKVKIRGDILLGKVYGYTDKFSDLKPVLLSNTFTVVPSLRYGISQKNNADIQLVLEGHERFGWSADKEIAEIDPGRDIGFGPAQTHQSFVLSKGEFVLFMPGEAHAPCLTAGAVGDPCRKLVIKIRMC